MNKNPNLTAKNGSVKYGIIMNSDMIISELNLPNVFSNLSLSVEPSAAKILNIKI